MKMGEEVHKAEVCVTSMTAIGKRLWIFMKLNGQEYIGHYNIYNNIPTFYKPDTLY